MTGYFLGVDIGGSKSHALVADENGRALGFGETGPGNHEVVGYPGLVTALQSVTGRAFASAGLRREQICAAGFGVAGYDWPSELAPTLEAIGTLKLDAPLEVVNDAVIGLLAGAKEGWGLVLIAGTGNNCRGRDRAGREGRVTGCGDWFGEYGGAGDLVIRAVQSIAFEWTQRGPATRLTQAFVDLVGACDVEDLLEGLAMERYRLNASSAPLVFQVARQGDPVAREVIQWAGRELGGLATGVIHQLQFEALDFEVVLAGSTFDIGPMLVDPLRETIHETAPGARLKRLSVPPVVGATLLAMRQEGLDGPDPRQTLIETTRGLLASVGRRPVEGSTHAA
jgi:N-acetylglucosamine kinase-like BadF-type ATPase